jgi:hypothetical protein
MMDPAAIGVTLGGVALAIGVNLYFFSPRRAAVAEVPPPRPAPLAGTQPAEPATPAAPGETPADDADDAGA